MVQRKKSQESDSASEFPKKASQGRTYKVTNIKGSASARRKCVTSLDYDGSILYSNRAEFYTY